MSLLRAVTAVAALCLAALALALGLTAAAERALPGGLLPEVSFAPLPMPRLDAHQHLGPATVADAVRLAAAHGVGALVNLSGGVPGPELEAQLAAARPFGGRVISFMNLDLEGCCDAPWAHREAGRLALGKAAGARGLAVGDALALALADAAPPGSSPPPSPLATDLLDPLWEACAALGLPVVVEAAGDPVPLVERQPRVTFVAARFADLEEEPAAVARLLDRLPNLWVDTARVPALARSPEAMRLAILSHPDRVLFGTDLQYVEGPGQEKAVVFGVGPPDEKDALRSFFGATFRFFETRDRVGPGAAPAEGPWDTTGLGLPREVLHAVYHRNAERLLGARVPEAGP